ncbi:MAG: hypothetical protein WD226_10860 [Planctomycetota bacterium]
MNALASLFLALPELDDVLRTIVLLLFFLLPALRGILRSLGVTKDGAAEKRAERARRRIDQGVPETDEASSLERLFGPPRERDDPEESERVADEQPWEGLVQLREPAPPPPPAAPLPVVAVPTVSRVPAAPAVTATIPIERLRAPAGVVLGPVPTEAEIEAGADIFRGGLAGSHDEALPTFGGRRRRARGRLAPDGWRRAVVLREVLGPPRAFQELEPR